PTRRCGRPNQSRPFSHGLAADHLGRALGAAASWSRRSVCARAGRVPGHLAFAAPAIAGTPTVRGRAATRVVTPQSARRAGAISRVLKDGSIIATINGPIARAVA